MLKKLKKIGNVLKQYIKIKEKKKKIINLFKINSAFFI